MIESTSYKYIPAVQFLRFASPRTLSKIVKKKLLRKSQEPRHPAFLGIQSELFCQLRAQVLHRQSSSGFFLCQVLYVKGPGSQTSKKGPVLQSQIWE